MLADGRCIPAMIPLASKPHAEDAAEPDGHEAAEAEEEAEDEENNEDGDPDEAGVEMDRQGGIFRPYVRPAYFELRLVGLLLLLIFTLSSVSLAVFVLPIAHGRILMTRTSLASPNSPPHDAITLFIGLANIVYYVKFML